MSQRDLSGKQPAPWSGIPGAGRLLQRKCACGTHTGGTGQCAACARTDGSSPLGIASAEQAIEPQRPSTGAAHASVSRDASTASSGPQADFAQLPVSDPAASGSPLPFLGIIQKSFGRHDVSAVRAHTDRAAAVSARSLGAEAFASGLDVTFAGPPRLHTAAHEAAHVVQQRSGLVGMPSGIGQEGDSYERHADAVADRVVRGQSSEALLDSHPGTRDAAPGSTKAPATASPPVIQLRRIPPNIRALLTSATGGDGANFAANLEGAERLVARALAELDPVDRVIVAVNETGTLTDAEFAALPRREQLSRTAKAIIDQVSKFELGDPKLIDTGPRPLTPDAANITKVVHNADAVFNAIATGAQDPNLKQVFGAANIGAAKVRYANARIWMNRLHAAAKIVTDRSGYSREVFQGGLTGFHEMIRVGPRVIDSPDDHDSVVTLLHESLHAGNTDVKDDLYITATGFKEQPNNKKLRNSAHYEVVPWRILDPASPNAFPVTPATTPPTFQTFIPAGTTVGGVTAPVRTAAEKGARAAYVKLNSAWALGLNLHLVYVQLFRTPGDWTRVQPKLGNIRFHNSVPFWSKVQKLTIHNKTTIDPTSADEAKRPVSQADIALSEGFVRKLAFSMDVLDPLHTESQILAFENANLTTGEQTTLFPGGTHTDENRERDVLLLLAVRDKKVAPMTGSVSRDLKVVDQLNAPSDAWSDILKPRNPASFVDFP